MRCDVVNALKELEIPVLRWPGGCFADDYHWRDGIGEKSQRPYMVNTNWGGVVENNHFGTHEFFELCEQLGTEPYICGNVGSGTVQEMRDWVESVSYTHLDVYKRQVIGSLFARIRHKCLAVLTVYSCSVEVVCLIRFIPLIR